MAKRTIVVLGAIALLAVPFISMMGQNKKQGQIKLTTRTDSLSYSLGQTVTVGVKQYLHTQGVLQDTATNSLIPDYEKLFDTADAKGKAELSKKLNQQKGEVSNQNKKSFATFLKGLEAALAAKGQEANSYNTGISIGSQLSATGDRFEKEMLSGDKIDKSILISSVIVALNDHATMIDNPQEYLEAEVMKMQEEREKIEAERAIAMQAEQIAKENAFLAENKTKEGVITLPSGLQYKVINEGSGAKPLQTDNVTVHYEGRLLDGTVFDSSYKRGEPTSFGVTQVIKGWTEALQIMPEGSKWTIYIPYDLAYGDRDQGPIKPFSTLIFDIELLEINK